jgi:[acyl-carrier-protein] S-malonyltransferase
VMARPKIEGEHLFAVERLVVSPAAGVFVPAPSVQPGDVIEVGTVVGHVLGQGEHVEVRSLFAGRVEAFIAVDGERLALRQPVCWLRVAG